ncbi:MAG: ABC transporter ATP-binding protein [Planctomycetota bacterium]|jgi:ABC-type multidrug transport system fused ATPase/permease subunit
MNQLGRVFDYVWKQWHRLIIVMISVIVIALLYVFSLGMISPFLTVIMGDEGLHGWAYRKMASVRYGMNFYDVDPVDVSDPNNPQVSYYLEVANVERKSAGDNIGIKRKDKIINIGENALDPNDPVSRMPSIEILKAFAAAPDNKDYVIQFQRPDKFGTPQTKSNIINSGKTPFYSDWVHYILSFVPPNKGSEQKQKAFIVIITLALIATIIRCLARFFQGYMAQKIVLTSLAGLREDAFGHSLKIPVGFYMQEGSSDSVSRLVRDTNEIGAGLKLFLGKALREPVKAIFLIVGAFMIHRTLTLFFLCSAPVAIFILANFGKKIRRFTKKTLANWAVMLGKLEETFAAIKVVKVYNREDYEHNNFTNVNRKLLKQQLRIAKVDAGAEPLLEIVGMLAATSVLVIGASWVFRGGMAEGDFFTLLFFLGAAAESIRRVSGVWNRVQQANAAATRVYSLVDGAPEPENPDAYEIGPLREKIEFRDIWFTYPGTDKPVIKDINLSIQAGHNVAIVGPNGSGKTTLTTLIPRFYDPDQGRILIDGKDIQQASFVSLRSHIGFVTQNVVTFHDTIAANIAYGKKDASINEVIDAAKRAYAHEFIEPLPDGYDTIIGEQGAGLSGGQLQRIVIARAILKNPAILIFDEATSQVDADSEAKIHKAIEEIMRDRTSIIIAHRFSTVAGAYQNLYKTQLVKT